MKFHGKTYYQFNLIFRSKPIQDFIFIFKNIYKPVILFFTRPLRIYRHNKSLFQNKFALEIGGPTPFFQKKNKKFPIYSILSNLDNCNFNENNFWASLKDGESIKFDNKNTGKQIISEASNLSKIEDSSYEILINSHVIEHVSNPLKALFEWKRVLKENGILVMIVPHKDGTYDHLRPLTEFDHLIDDFHRNVNEDDPTHLQEVIKLHDMNLDTTVSSLNEHYERTMDNFKRRIVHHHVFNTFLVARMIDYVGLKIIDMQVQKPYNIIVIAQKLNIEIENNKFLDKNSKLYKTSFFPSDRM